MFPFRRVSFSSATKGGFPTFFGVAGVNSRLLRPGPDAEHPGHGDEREQHGRERQGNLL